MMESNIEDANYNDALQKFARMSKNPVRSLRQLVRTMKQRIEDLQHKNDRENSEHNHIASTKENIALHEEQGTYPKPLIEDAESIARYQRRIQIARILVRDIKEKGLLNPDSKDDTARGSKEGDERTKALEVVNNHPALQEVLKTIGMLKVNGKNYGIAIAEPDGRVLLMGNKIRRALRDAESNKKNEKDEVSLGDIFANATIEFANGTTVHLENAHAEDATGNSVSTLQYIKVPNLNNSKVLGQSAMKIAPQEPKPGESVYAFSPENLIGAIKLKAGASSKFDNSQFVGEISDDAKKVLSGDLVVTNEKGELVNILERGSSASSEHIGAGLNQTTGLGWKEIAQQQNNQLGDRIV